MHTTKNTFLKTINAESKFRFAPTPSGYLHIGNGLNFVLNWLFARAVYTCPILLRIDDLDKARKRTKYVEDIFQTLDWLGLDYDEGPSGVVEFEKQWSQSLRSGTYEEFLSKLKERALFFPCQKSRKELLAYAHYPLKFREQEIQFSDADTAWRIFGDRANGIDDFVVRKKNGEVAYQVASLVDDLNYGITHIVRGADLEESTRLQLYLAEVAGSNSFLGNQFWHHPLIQDSRGQKLSKSKGAVALQTRRTAGQRPNTVYSAVLKILNLPDKKLNTSADLLAFFKTIFLQMAFKLEICAPNIPSVDAAAKAKSESYRTLCGFEIGGITPSAAMIRYAARRIETHVLIRPRTGHLYNRQEFRTMFQDIAIARKAGAKGVVLGILNKKHMPNKYELRYLIEAAEGMECTFHRAFDVCKQPLDALEVLITLGFKRILTSGAAVSAWEGREMLHKLQERADGRITIMPGGGISPENVLELRRATGCSEFHASAKLVVESDAPTLDGLDSSYWQSDVATIRNLKVALEYAV